MNKKIKVNLVRLAALAALFSAGPAAAEVGIRVDPAAVASDTVYCGRLSDAAESISAAVKHGDSVGASEQISGFFSGSAAKPAAAPVKFSAAPAARVPAASAAVPVTKGAVPVPAAAAEVAKSSDDPTPSPEEGEEGGGGDGGGDSGGGDSGGGSLSPMGVLVTGLLLVAAIAAPLAIIPLILVLLV